ncbi:MAG: DUF5134 domain-containing protein [Acidimicrobiales bacterium]
MPFPSWIGYLFAASLMLVGAYYLARLAGLLVLHRHDGKDIAVSHVLMALAMVGMLVPRWNVGPVGFWEIAFACAALWFFIRAILGRANESSSLAASAGRYLRHYLIHAVMACTMLYMYWLGMPISGSVVMPTMGQSMSSGRSAGAGDPALTLCLIVVMIASAPWQLDGIGRPDHLHEPVTVAAMAGGASVTGLPAGTGERPVRRSGTPAWLAPQFSDACHIVMYVAMAYMLVLMV